MKRAAALCFVVGACACSRHVIDVDPLLDRCAGLQPLAIDVDVECSDDDFDRNRCVVGDVVVGARVVASNEEDRGRVVSDASELRVVTGSLVFQGAPNDLRLPFLQAVGGCLDVATDGAFDVAFPNLSEAGRVVLRDPTLSVADLAGLRRGDVEVDGTRLTALNLTAHQLGGVSVHNARSLGAIATQTRAGDLVIDGAPVLDDVDAPALEDAARVAIYDTRLPALELGALRHVGRLDLIDNADLTRISLPALESVDALLRLHDNGVAGCDLVDALSPPLPVIDLDVDLDACDAVAR